MVEKPKPDEAPSRLAVAGRYILTPAVPHASRTMPRGAAARSSSPTASRLLAGEACSPTSIEGRRYDCGSKEGFLEANVDLALKHPERGPASAST